jgi:phosphinothricin acetyltransferase
MTPPVTVRAATEADAEAICRIYNQGIEDRIATLETELRTPAERRHWMASRSRRHPVIVAETAPSPPTERREGEGGARPMVVGWGSLNPFNPRKAYDHVADFSVYIERGWRGQGVGRALLGHLVELAREIGYHKMVLAAFPFNEAGVALYERLGFRRVGVYREQGLLDGKWVDTIIMERLL